MKIDKEIIEGCKRGERKYQEILYDKLYSYIMGICYRYFLSKEVSKDIFNIVMFKVLTKIDTYNENYAFSTWVANITVNTIISEFRKNKKHQHLQFIENYEPFQNNFQTLNEFIHSMDTDEILELFKCLNDTERIVLNMVAIEGYEYKEVAEKLNMKEPTIRWYYYQAKNKLKEILENEYYLNK